MLGGKRHVFVDGAITPYNNPALIAALMAVLPCYRLAWETGPDKIRLISVGTMRFSLAATDVNVRRMWVGYHAAQIPAALMQGIALEQDCLCRCLGQCIHGEELDSEIGNLEGTALPGRSWFSYAATTDRSWARRRRSSSARTRNLPSSMRSKRCPRCAS